MLEQFFNKLDIKSLASSACVCQRWYLVIEGNPELWERHKRHVLERKGVLLLPSKCPCTGRDEWRLIEQLFGGRSMSDGPQQQHQQQQLRKRREKLFSNKISTREMLQEVSSANSSYAEDITVVIHGM